MLEIDLEEFVASGTFGCLGRAPTRELVMETLGQRDSDGYPEHDQYGNVSFEFDATLNGIYRIMIAFPHALNQELKENAWPDSRFHLKTGRFKPGLKLRQVTGSLPDFKHADMIGENPNRICVYTNRIKNIDLCFAPETSLGDYTLYCIVSHPETDNPEIGITNGCTRSPACMRVLIQRLPAGLGDPGRYPATNEQLDQT